LCMPGPRSLTSAAPSPPRRPRADCRWTPGRCCARPCDHQGPGSLAGTSPDGGPDPPHTPHSAKHGRVAVTAAEHLLLIATALRTLLELMYGSIEPAVVTSPRVGMHVTRAVVAASGLMAVALLALLAVNTSSQRCCLLSHANAFSRPLGPLAIRLPQTLDLCRVTDEWAKQDGACVHGSAGRRAQSCAWLGQGKFSGQSDHDLNGS